MKMKKILAIMLAVVMLAALAACSNGDDKTPDNSVTGSPDHTGTGGPGENVQVADTVRILLEAPIASLDTLNAASAGNGPRAIYRCIMDKLVGITPQGVYTPELATSWSTNDDINYTFNLRNDVYFHNGQKFTAQDVINTVELAQAAVGTNAHTAYKDIVSITAPDEYTVEIVLRAVNVDFMYNLTNPCAAILCKAAIDADPVKGAWVGTGAFTVTGFSSGDYVTLTRNDNYWGEPAVSQTLQFNFVPENAARVIMLQNGETHLVTGGIDVEHMPTIENAPDKYTIYSVIANLGFGIMFNTNNPVTGDKNFRAAVTYAINVPEAAWVGAEKWAYLPVSGAFWGNSTEFLNTSLPIRNQDVELAKQYLAESSYNGEQVEIMSGTEASVTCAVLIAEQMRAIGINVLLTNTDFISIASTDTQGNSETQMINNLAPFTLRASSSRGVYHTEGGTNRGKFSNPEMDRMLDQASSITDDAEREALYMQLQQMFYDEYLGIMLFHRDMPLIATAHLRGLIIDPEMNHDFRYMYVELG